MNASVALLAIADRRFQRGQLEHALWRWFAGAGPQATPPETFRGRIRKLLDLDRSETVLASVGEVKSAPFAFYDARPRGQGHETPFSPFNGFCLALGLDLIDLGFKQAEVVFLLRHIRADLELQFRGILAEPPAPRMPQDSDRRLFMSFSKVELTERLGAGAPKTGPVFMKPRFTRGVGATTDVLDQLDCNNRKTVVVELGETAVLVCRHLDSAPAVPRGRPARK